MQNKVPGTQKLVCSGSGGIAVCQHPNPLTPDTLGVVGGVVLGKAADGMEEAVSKHFSQRPAVLKGGGEMGPASLCPRVLATGVTSAQCDTGDPSVALHRAMMGAGRGWGGRTSALRRRCSRSSAPGYQVRSRAGAGRPGQGGVARAPATADPRRGGLLGNPSQWEGGRRSK